MIRKAEGINSLGYSFSDIILFHATGVAATIGMVMVVTPHTRIRKLLKEEEVRCSCSKAKNHESENELTKLSSTSEAASLLQILGDRILLLLYALLELSNPLNVCLSDVRALTKSLGLVCKTVTKISVLNKLGENLITVGSKSSIVESVYVLSNAVGCNTELLAAKLVEFDEVIYKLFI